MIDTSLWHPFKIKELFDIKKGKRLTKKAMIEGETAFVGSSAFNNGITNYIGNKENIHEGNLITVAYNGSVGETFYHDEQFIASDDVNVLYPKFKLNKYIALFMCPIIKKAGQDYKFIDKWKKADMEKTLIYLPSTPDKHPDFEYMEKYMKNIMDETENTLEKIKQIDRLNHYIDVSSWGEFIIENLFEKLELGYKKSTFNKASDISLEPTDEFNLPLVNAKHDNNGIMYYGREEDWDSAEMTIDIVADGAASTGDVYAQPQRTGVLYNAYLVKPLWDCKSEYVLQFMACIIEKCVKSHFGYENKCTWNKVKKETIKLPITPTGEPDWQYMEDYMKMIMQESESKISILENLS